MSTLTPRSTCWRCRRALSVCYCAACPRLATRTRVVILQHPRERTMPIGTARMASLCLPQATLLIGLRWGDSAALANALADPERQPILLYPGAGARDVLRDPPSGSVTLVVVDGTWSQAKNVVRDNPVLQALPRYAFSAPEPSRYRIRSEPRAEYVSTIEALMHVLGVLEGDAERFRALLAPLNAMVEAQLARRGISPRHQRRRARPARSPRDLVPDAVATRFADLVCIVGEANAWPHSARPTAPAAEIVHCVVHRPATGACFEKVAAPQGPLSPTTSAHLEIAAERLRRGVPSAELIAELMRFLRPTDVLCSWGHFGTNLLAAAGAVLPRERLDLRALAKRLGRGGGCIEAFAATLPAQPPPLGDGRAGRRVAVLARFVRQLRALVECEGADVQDRAAPAETREATRAEPPACASGR